ncbi:hypothetical protein A3A49_02785 [Candidatus Curtissbacteria bacterium RIFCSPLOWO2_01_FULL_38_11b]|uniref:Type 4 fimbrial biogenesis protein PilX N-terminal domain-containing protein n=1 Tax=Candidatus Curtissbacteria bacterium RIFCSPLOWO2_01_FULL_38_11b TaxID=1797725 RepID=A0A1F5H158_9BACT|nr:MAG: hypothetical protein A3A49_02785 [Candidatus Curtissbacteria bacterium RIFCSPLOWO2_01_FULL_38_11b]
MTLPKFRASLKAGQAMVLAFFYLAIVVMISLILYTKVIHFRTFGASSILNEQAVSLAEAGVEHALFQLNTDPNPLSYHGDDTRGSAPDFPGLVFGQGTFKVDVHPIVGAGGDRKITSEGCIPNCTNPKAKRVITVDAAMGPISIPFVLHSGEIGALLEIDPAAQVEGNVYSNGDACREGGCHLLPFDIVNGDVWAGGTTNLTVSGAETEGADYLALPNLDVDSFNNQAFAGGADGFTIYCGGSHSLGPRQIVSLRVEGTCGPTSLTVTGPIHITGGLTVDQDADFKIYLDESFGSTSTAIVVDGTIDIENVEFFATSASPTKGFVILVYTGDSATPLVHVWGNFVFFSVGNARIEISNNDSEPIQGAVLAAQLHVDHRSIINYDPDLSSIDLPGSGGPWRIIRGTYKIGK